MRPYRIRFALTGTDALRLDTIVRPYTATWGDDGRTPARHPRASLQRVTRPVRHDNGSPSDRSDSSDTSDSSDFSDLLPSNL